MKIRRSLIMSSRPAGYAWAENTRAESKTLITEGGVEQRVSACRREERQQAGWGLGKIPKWGRYTYLRTDRDR